MNRPFIVLVACLWITLVDDARAQVTNVLPRVGDSPPELNSHPGAPPPCNLLLPSSAKAVVTKVVNPPQGRIATYEVSLHVEVDHPFKGKVTCEERWSARYVEVSPGLWQGRLTDLLQSSATDQQRAREKSKEEKLQEGLKNLSRHGAVIIDVYCNTRLNVNGKSIYIGAPPCGAIVAGTPVVPLALSAASCTSPTACDPPGLWFSDPKRDDGFILLRGRPKLGGYSFSVAKRGESASVMTEEIKTALSEGYQVIELPRRVIATAKIPALADLADDLVFHASLLGCKSGGKPEATACLATPTATANFPQLKNEHQVHSLSKEMLLGSFAPDEAAPAVRAAFRKAKPAAAFRAETRDVGGCVASWATRPDGKVSLLAFSCSEEDYH